MTNLKTALNTKETDMGKLNSTVRHLETIIKSLPKNPSANNFALLEKKLELIDRNYKEQQLEFHNNVKKINQKSPMFKENVKLKEQIKKERKKFQLLLARKNKEITGFRQEMATIMKTMSAMRGGAGSR